MKKLIILIFALMAMSFLGATILKHWTGSINTYVIVPDLVAPALPRVAVIFEPDGPCVFNNVSMSFYQPGSLGEPQVLAELRPVDALYNIDESGFAPPSVLKQYSEIVWHGGTTLFDFSALPVAARTFTTGQKFAIVLSVPNATSSINIGVLGVSGQIGNSYTYIDTYGWLRNDDVFSNPIAWAWTADVTYSGPYTDLEATDIYYTGDMFLQPEDQVLYGADVTSNSDIPVTGTVKIQVLDQATSTELWSQTWTDQAFPVSVEPVHFVCTAPPVTAYPATEGDYQLILTVTMTGDMDATNDWLELEQITYAPPGLMDYTDDLDSEIPDNAYGWTTTNSGPEVGVDFWYYAAPLTLQTVGFRVWDATWPAGVVGNEFLNYAIYNWVDGSPNLLYVTPNPVPCVLGQWNDYDVSALGLSFEAGESFMVTYKQYSLYPNCPGLACDESAPLSGWATSYFWDPDDLTWYLGYDQDFMIRVGAIETLGVEAPIISIALVDGYPEISWAEVTGAVSYNVYGSNDPYISDPLASPPWTPLITGTGDLGYQYTGTEPYEFFYVTASTEVDGSKMATQLKPVRAPKDKAIRVKAPRPETMLIEAVAK